MVFIIYMISGAISLGMIVHCIKTGRNTIWVYVLVVMMSTPFVGSALYAGVEILPELLRSRTSRRAMRGIRSTLDPEGSLRKFEIEMKVTGNVAARQKYADELVKLDRAKEALPIYQTCLTGVFAEDPKLMLGYAHAQFAAEDPVGARKTLDELIQKNPDFKSPDGHLLYARALEAEGDVAKALAEYATLAEYFPGAEAPVRYAKLLNRSDQRPLAQQTLKALLDRAKYAPAHYRKAQREWLDEAHRELQNR
ncbi:MAG: tetratricopeptide repeat protein [Pseudomonadota bacterium]